MGHQLLLAVRHTAAAARLQRHRRHSTTQPRPPLRPKPPRKPRHHLDRRRNRHGNVRHLLNSRMGRAIRTLNGARLVGDSVGIDTARLSRSVSSSPHCMPASRASCSRISNASSAPRHSNLGASIDYLFMVIIGGAGSLWGAPLGATLVVVLRDQFNDWIPRITGRVGDFETSGIQPRCHLAAAASTRRFAAAARTPEPRPASERRLSTAMAGEANDSNTVMVGEGPPSTSSNEIPKSAD